MHYTCLLEHIFFNLLQNLQTIQKATHNINLKLKDIQKEMHITTALMNAIEMKTPVINQD